MKKREAALGASPAPVKANGGARPAETGGGSRQRSASIHEDQTTTAEAMLAGYARLFPGAVVAPAWPVHLTMWLEPRMETPLPSGSGLRVERNHKIPARMFCGQIGPVRGSHSPIRIERIAVSAVTSAIPASGLQPIGWEPRNLLPAARAGLRSDVTPRLQTIGRLGGQ
jgi:hypothetical protein